MNVLHPVSALAGHELRLLFGRPQGWAFLAGFLLVAGAMWTVLLHLYIAAEHHAVAAAFGDAALDLTAHLVAPWFHNLTFAVSFAAPILAARTLSDEYRQHSFELLASSAITSGHIVAGKFAGIALALCAWILATVWLPLTLFAWARPDIGPIACGYLALFGTGFAGLAVGMAASAITESTAVALLIAETATLVLWLVGRLDESPGSWASHASLPHHAAELPLGLVSATDLAYFAAVTVVALVAARESVEARRWR